MDCPSILSQRPVNKTSPATSMCLGDMERTFYLTPPHTHTQCWFHTLHTQFTCSSRKVKTFSNSYKFCHTIGLSTVPRAPYKSCDPYWINFFLSSPINTIYSGPENWASDITSYIPSSPRSPCPSIVLQSPIFIGSSAEENQVLIMVHMSQSFGNWVSLYCLMWM